jgi:hypothetical protein
VSGSIESCDALLFCPRPSRGLCLAQFHDREQFLSIKESPESQFKGLILFHSGSRIDDAHGYHRNVFSISLPPLIRRGTSRIDRKKLSRFPARKLLDRFRLAMTLWPILASAWIQREPKGPSAWKLRLPRPPTQACRTSVGYSARDYCEERMD